jgi:mannose-1-phosphate guanylyltransferase
MSKGLTALILSGGQGTRLRPLTLYAPKPLLPIANAPFLSYPLALLRKHGTREVVLCTSDALKPYGPFLRDQKRRGTRVSCSKETVELGTAGAVKNAERSIGSDPFFVFNGDVLSDVDLTGLIRYHRQKKALITVVMIPVADPTGYGLVLRRPDGRISRFIEKPSGLKIGTQRRYWINAGMYLFSREALDLIPSGRKSSIERELFPLCLKRRLPLYGYAASPSSYWLDIGTPERFLEANRDAAAGKLKGLRPGPRIAPGTRVHPSAKIGPGTLIGKNCRIEPHAELHGCVLLDGASVGEGAVLENCVVGDRARIQHHSVVRRARIVGNRSILTPYTQL